MSLNYLLIYEIISNINRVIPGQNEANKWSRIKKNDAWLKKNSVIYLFILLRIYFV